MSGHQISRLISQHVNHVWNAGVDPLGSFYYYFLGLVTVAALYNVVGCSIFVFEECLQFYELWLTLNVVSDLINLLDLLIQCRLSYLKHGILITNWRKTFFNYTNQAHFYLDLAALLPTDFFLLFRPQQSFWRLNRLLKLFYRSALFVKRTEIRTDFPHLFCLLRLVVTCVAIFHFNGCLYHMFSFIYLQPDLTINDWIWIYSPAKIPNLRYANCDARFNVGRCIIDERNRNFWRRDLYIEELRAWWADRFEETEFGNLTRKYTLSFYWSALTLTTLGEQPWPNNTSQMIFETFDTILGLLLFAIILGQIASMISHMNSARTQFEEVRDGCKQFMQFRRVESDVQTRVLRFLDFKGVPGQTMLTEEEVARTLPGLHAELSAEVHLNTLRSLSVFAACEPSLLIEVAERLQLQTFCPGEIICRDEDVGVSLKSE